MYTIINEGIRNHNMVFDEQFNGYCSKRLIYLMKRNTPLIDTIYISPECFLEFLPDYWIDNSTKIKIFGIELVFDEGLNPSWGDTPDGVYLKHFKDCEGILYNGEFLLVGFKSSQILDKNNIVFGCC